MLPIKEQATGACENLEIGAGAVFSLICCTPMVSFFIDCRKWSNLTKRKSNLWRKWSSLTKGSGNGLIRGSRCPALTQIVPDESLPSHRGFFPPNNQHSEQLPVWRKRGEVYRVALLKAFYSDFQVILFPHGANICIIRNPY